MSKLGPGHTDSARRVRRAGRADLAGEVILQSHLPDHYALQLACAQDYDAFFDLVNVSKDSGVKRFIYASSSSVYGVKAVGSFLPGHDQDVELVTATPVAEPAR